MTDGNETNQHSAPDADILVKVGYHQMMVREDGTVFRQTRGEWRQVKSGLTFSEALRKAENLRAIRASADARDEKSREARGQSHE